MGVFHKGEIAVQRRLGVNQHIGPIAQKFIRNYMPEQHREFFTNQCVLYAGVLDDDGHPWATPIIGQQGFIESGNPKTLQIDKRPLIEFSNILCMQVGDKLGLLGLEFNTRRRNRVNGLVSYVSDQAFRFEVEQSFGNCPKYIQGRELLVNRSSNEPVITASSFDLIALADTGFNQTIMASDTFFIASRSAQFGVAQNSGVDISHRGGKPGFVARLADGKLIFPDFSGNNFFNTLGNIESDSRVGLYFPDFVSGQSFWIKGRAEIIWDELPGYRYQGAQRYVVIAIEQIIGLKTASLVQKDRVELSPHLDNSGAWL
ncbi:pyridoxamine 5'-phosphate oxidase [Alginatibacterium sediminis]|uniref:Pyridoxamine 5'-phosphate oxidase n=1 Tax=Alginatibacterium sediminis TaxID=2164068 RepID=A0A420E6D7_9ALTE|nr:pyridoxamine 5'-phosphate oxidase family protein [Alginatibacterium sediminis]RKF13716.1 pyridoxamine 5'-phosphate oxidase [Alginatibacterium sediminis]